jgi:hypothetical protein
VILEHRCDRAHISDLPDHKERGESAVHRHIVEYVKEADHRGAYHRQQAETQEKLVFLLGARDRRNLLVKSTHIVEFSERVEG